MGAPFALVGAEGGEKRGDLGAVDIVAAALTLRLEHVRGRAREIGGERDGLLPCGRAVERIDGGKSLADAVEEGGGRGQEAFEIRGRGRRERLLDFLGAGQMGEDGGAFDRGAAFEVGARVPRVGRGVFGRRVTGTEVEQRDFIRSAGGMRGIVNQGAAPVVGWDGGVDEDGGEGEVVGGDLGQTVGESELVEDVVFMRLDDEENA